MEQTKTNNKIKKPEYYINKKRKSVDFIIGFVGSIICYIILFIVTPRLKISYNPTLMVFVLLVLIIFFSGIFFNNIKRYYITKGLFIGIFLIPIIFLLYMFGACINEGPI